MINSKYKCLCVDNTTSKVNNGIKLESRDKLMKTILCYGDSLTWGYDADTGSRFSYDKRWTGVLQGLLGKQYRVIEEGLNGRTTVYNDEFTPFAKYGVGSDTLPMVLDTHRPIDLVIIILGTNDFQLHRNSSPALSARGVTSCIKHVLNSMAGPEMTRPKVLVISPPTLRPAAGFMRCAFSSEPYDAHVVDGYFKLCADTFATEFLAGSCVEACDTDGIHLDVAANQKLAKCVAAKARQILL